MPHLKITIDAIRMSELGKLKNQAVLILKEEGEERFLPIWVSSAQADILTKELKCLPIEQRAVPGQFLKDISASFSDVICITIHFDNGVYYAKVLLYLKDKPLEMKCPIGVALSLAYRTQAQILVNSEIMDKYSLSPQWDWRWGASDVVIKAASIN
jgi:bifunctional DNase/RNase